MSIEEKYKKKNIYVQQCVKSKMEDVKKGLSKKDYAQLSIILEELEKMMNNKCLSLCYPRFIVDSWDFNDKLGLELLELAKLYRRWK